MGKYINPPGESKEAWLAREGVKCSRDDVLECDVSGDDDGLWPVALIDNGLFTAAAVMYSLNEQVTLTDPRAINGRPVTYWLVERKKLKRVMG